MSTEKKNWFGRLIAAIALTFKNNYESWLKKLWNNMSEDLKPDLVEVVDWIQIIKTKYLDSLLLDAIVLAWPGDKDDKALAWLRKVADSAILAMRAENLKVADLNDLDRQSLASVLSMEVTGLDLDQASTTIKTAYWNEVKMK